MNRDNRGVLATVRSRPLLFPLVLCALFLSFSVFYIHTSTALAARFSDSVAQLQRIEAIKGTAFMFITALLVFGVTAMLCLRIAQQMREIEQHRDALLQSERRALTGCFAASVAHDLNNILTIIGLQVQEMALREDLADSPNARLAQELEDSVGKLATLSRKLMEVGKEGVPGQFRREELGSVLRGCLDLAQSRAKAAGCKATLRVEGPVGAEINRSSVEQMVINLLLNAIEACGRGDQVKLCLYTAGDEALIEVHDSGPGVQPEHAGQIFKPFFTTKPKGTGLGLLSVKACVELHGGDFEVARSDLGGACFRIRLSLRRPDQADDGDPDRLPGRKSA